MSEHERTGHALAMISAVVGAGFASLWKLDFLSMHGHALLILAAGIYALVSALRSWKILGPRKAP